MTEEPLVHNCVVAAMLRYPDYNLSQDPQVLMLQRNDADDYWPGHWYLLSEHINPGETELETARRGIIEEIGKANVEVYKGPYRNLDSKVDAATRERFLLTAYTFLGPYHEIKLTEMQLPDSEIVRYRWCDPSEPLSTYPEIQQVIEGTAEDLRRLGIRCNWDV